MSQIHTHSVKSLWQLEPHRQDNCSTTSTVMITGIGNGNIYENNYLLLIL